MAWFDSYQASANQYIVDNVDYESYSISFINGSTYSRTIYRISERYVGMTQAAAVRDARTISQQNPTWQVSALPENNGGGWTIRISRETWGAWTLVT